MLVISRKQEESIIIEPEKGGEPIEVKIISIDNQVRIGISAPRGCKIWRNELFKTVELNRSAAEVSSVGNLRSLAQQIAGEHE
ncbi:MAG: carbon storage regulator [Clostridiales bacterium]|jgi:carbon storage regulator CsrA|nr:carbon storage regulator [Clostridiales bacterium]